MKILSGRYRGRNIKTSLNLGYRPTKSIVRKSLFDKLMPFDKKTVLDLFSGTGIMGFEAISRGACSVTFVDNNKTILKILKKNAEELLDNDYYIYNLDVFRFLKNANLYDFIFADPPYGFCDLYHLAEIVIKHLNPKGIFILECENKVEPFLNAMVSDYGNTRVLIWENS